MIVGLESVSIFSANAENLANFYKNKVGLKIATEAEMGDKGEELYELELGEGPSLYIIDHSGVKGKNRDASRIVLNLEVDDIEKEVQKLGKSGVKKIEDIVHVQGYGLIAIFEDVDGNYFQVVQVRES